jgi:biofilm PGA synthesis N-glycosyltransferase PgaC
VNGVTASGEDPLPRRGKRSENVARNAGGALDAGLGGWRSWPEWDREGPDLDTSTRIGLGQIAGEARSRSPVHDRRHTPGVDVLRPRPGPVQDRTMAVPIPRLIDEATTGGVTGDTLLAGLGALVSLSTPVPDVPATVERPGVRKSATDGAEKRLAATPLRRSAGDEARPTMIVALIPAHNEEASIAATIESVLGQTRVPDKMVVMCDKCTDRTAEIASRYEGVTVSHSLNNMGRKAGAMNQALDVLLPRLNDDDLVLCMDADTILHPELIANAQRHFQREPAFGAVSANQAVRPHRNLLELIQAMEYERTRRYIGRRQGAGSCMSGATTVFRVKALRALYQKYGEVYMPGAWTEDWMITYALKHQGYKLLKPQDCMITTAPVPRWGRLFKQRQRWSHGYIEAIAHFGLTRYTAMPWLGIVFWAFSSALWGAWLLLVGQMLSRGLAFHIQPWVAVIMALLVYARVYTVKRCGGRAMLLAGLVLPEMIYGWWITAASTSGLVKHLTGINGQWDSVKVRMGKHRRKRTLMWSKGSIFTDAPGIAASQRHQDVQHPS